MNKNNCHCEPVTDVTGVEISRIDEKSLKIREIPTPVCALARNDMVVQHAEAHFVLKCAFFTLES